MREAVVSIDFGGRIAHQQGGVHIFCGFDGTRCFQFPLFPCYREIDSMDLFGARVRATVYRFHALLSGKMSVESGTLFGAGLKFSRLIISKPLFSTQIYLRVTKNCQR